MAKQTINVGTADKGNGDPLRTAFIKVNSNFNELYAALGADLTSVASHIIPETDDTYDLGSATHKWRSLYVSSNTIYLDNIPLSVVDGVLKLDSQTVGGTPAWSDITGKPAIPSTLDSLTDVFITGASSGQVLKYDGSNWVNGTDNSGNPDKLIAGGKEVVLTGGTNPFVTFPAVATGENITIQGAEIASANGTVAITSSGSVVVNTNALTALNTWTFGDDGNLTLPVGGDILDSTGTSILSSGTGNVTFSTNVVQGTGYELGLSPGSGFTGDNQYFRIRGGDVPEHLHFDTSDSTAYDLYVGDDSKYFKLSKDGPAVIQSQDPSDASTHQWIFGSDGNLSLPSGFITSNQVTGLNLRSGYDVHIISNHMDVDHEWILDSYGDLTIPGGIKSENAINIDINLSDSSLQRWRFGEDGELTFPDGTSQSTAYTGSGITASSSDTFTNKTINIAFGQGNTFQIQGNSISSYSGSGAVLLLQSMPTLNAFNIGNSSNLTVDGGTGSYYWSGPSGVAGAGIDKAGVYRSSSSATNSLFTFAANGSGTMSAAIEGSLFVGTARPSNNGGLNTDYSGWLVVQSGGKFGGDLNTRGALIFDDAATGAVVFADGTRQTTAWDTGYLSFDDAALRGTSGYTYTFNTDGYFTSSTSSESTSYFFVTYNSTNLNIAAGWTVVGANCNTTVSSTVYPVAGYPGVIRVNLTAAASATSGFYPVVVTSPDRLKVQIQPNPGNASKYTFATTGITFPDATQQTTAFTGNAATVDILATNGLTTTMYPAFVDATTGTVVVRADQDLTYRTDDNLLTAGNISTGVLKIDDGVHEKFQTKSNATGTVDHDCSVGHIFYHTTPSANWTANFTNLNLASGYATTVTLVIEQGGTGYYPNALQIGGANVGILWQGNATPTPSTNRVDVVTFSILYDGLYTVLGQLTGF